MYLGFQLAQLEEAQLKKGEQEELEGELAVLSHAETIKSVLSRLVFDFFSKTSILSEYPCIPSNFRAISSFNANKPSNPEFVVSMVPSGEYTFTGKDEVKFLFAANKNQKPGEIAKVASGGEISRSPKNNS